MKYKTARPELSVWFSIASRHRIVQLLCLWSRCRPASPFACGLIGPVAFSQFDMVAVETPTASAKAAWLISSLRLNRTTERAVGWNGFFFSLSRELLPRSAFFLFDASVFFPRLAGAVFFPDTFFWRVLCDRERGLEGAEEVSAAVSSNSTPNTSSTSAAESDRRRVRRESVPAIASAAASAVINSS